MDRATFDTAPGAPVAERVFSVFLHREVFNPVIRGFYLGPSLCRQWAVYLPGIQSRPPRDCLCRWGLPKGIAAGGASKADFRWKKTWAACVKEEVSRQPWRLKWSLQDARAAVSHELSFKQCDLISRLVPSVARSRAAAPFPAPERQCPRGSWADAEALSREAGKMPKLSPKGSLMSTFELGLIQKRFLAAPSLKEHLPLLPVCFKVCDIWIYKAVLNFLPKPP